MKDLNNTATIELFPAAKKQGRPATGKAKTAAQRQAAYRRNKQVSGDLGGINLNVWVDLRATCALERLMKHYGLSKAEMLEKLMLDADKLI